MSTRRDILNQDLERGLEDGCRNGLTHRDSDSFGIMIDNDDDGYTEVSIPNAHLPPQVEVMEWTDEKHSSYLDSLESSFVKQLHHSLGLRGGHYQEKLQGRHGYQERAAGAPISSNQFVILQNRYRQRISFEKKQPLLESTADSQILLKSPWIRRYTSAEKHCDVDCTDPREYSVLIGAANRERGNATPSSGLARSSEMQPTCNPCQEDLVGLITEVSDQNFVDKNQEQKSSNAPKAKRLRTTASSDASNKDQVVPSGNFHSANISTLSNTLEKER